MKDFVKKLVRGQLSKKQLGFFFLPLLALLLVSWLISRALYPHEGGFKMDLLQISRQGNIGMNPIGAWFFIFSTTLVGILLVFFFVHVFRVFSQERQGLWKGPELFLVSGVIGGIGLAMVAAFPEGESSIINLIHGIGSGMAFSGLGTAAGLSFLIMFIKMNKKASWPESSQAIGLFLMMLQFLLMFPFIESMSVFQWTGFYLIFVWITGLFLILPENHAMNAK